MQAREAHGRTATILSSRPSLPFAMSGPDVVADPLPSALTTRLDALQQLAVETQNRIELLRRQNAQIVRLLTPAPMPASGANQSLVQAPTAASVADADGPSGRSTFTGEKACLRIYLLGTFEIRADGKTVTHWPSRKSRMLLAYLAMEKNRLLPKDVLVELFWPDSSLSRGSNNLSIAIHQIRTALKELLPGGTHGVRVRQGLYGLDQTLVGWVDLHEFQRSLSDARIALQRRDRGAARRHLLAAVDLYRGEFLESDPYEEWTVEPRRSNSAALGRALTWLAGDAAESKDWERVLDYAREIVRREPCDEEGHRWLMTVYWQLGKRAHALLQYQMCSERLVNDLGVQPSEETQKLFLKIRGGE